MSRETCGGGMDGRRTCVPAVRSSALRAGQPTQPSDRHTLVEAEKSKPVLLTVAAHMGIQFNNNNNNMCPIVL